MARAPTGRITPSTAWRGTRRGRIVRGKEGGYPARPSGSMQPAATMAEPFPGDTLRQQEHWRTTEAPGRQRWGAIRWVQARSARWTWRETYGSGRRTGTRMLTRPGPAT